MDCSESKIWIDKYHQIVYSRLCRYGWRRVNIQTLLDLTLSRNIKQAQACLQGEGEEYFDSSSAGLMQAVQMSFPLGVWPFIIRTNIFLSQVSCLDHREKTT